MNRVKTLASALLILLACASFSDVQAQSRAYLSEKNGSNTGSCGSLSSPCATLSYILTNNLVATGGEVIILDSSKYDQAGVTINKALTVSAPTGINAGFKGTTGAAITVSAGSTEAVVLRGLNITGGDSGITYSSGAVLHVENCLINRADSYGIYATAAGKLFVKDSEVRNATAYVNSVGVMLLPTSGTLTTVLDRTRVENCTSAGVYVSDGVKAFVRNGVISGAGTGLSCRPAEYGGGVDRRSVRDRQQHDRHSSEWGGCLGQRCSRHEYNHPAQWNGPLCLQFRTHFDTHRQPRWEQDEHLGSEHDERLV